MTFTQKKKEFQFCGNPLKMNGLELAITIHSDEYIQFRIGVLKCDGLDHFKSIQRFAYMLIGMRCRWNQPDQNHPAWNDGIGHSTDKNSMLLPQLSHNCRTEFCTSFCENRGNRAFRWEDVVANLL